MSIKSTLRPIVWQSRAIGRYLKRKLDLTPPPPVSREPAFDPETRAWFMERIGSVRAYVEYGAGASSLLASDAGVPTISIESDAAYAKAVQDALSQGKRDIPSDSSVINEVRVADIGTTEDWGSPLWIVPVARHAERWKAYPEAGPKAIAALGRFPDLVLVDGRFRVACCLAMIRAAIRESAETQILFDDYVLREQYAGVEDVLGTPELIGRAALFTIQPATLNKADIDRAYERTLSDYR
ncbi:MAG: hypothetical protein WA908_09710 [Pontixanthobacter sp.]